MKLFLCLIACFVIGSTAQTVTNWDLSELDNSGSGIVEADKAPQKVLDRKATNQGFNSKITTSGKNAGIALTVTKERAPRVTDVDRLLFGLEATEINDVELTNTTFSYSETSSVVATVLGSTWETQIHLPTEDLSYIELLRLSASLNEYTLITHHGGSPGGKARDVRAPGSAETARCICHGTAHHFPYEMNNRRFKKTTPFWGVRILESGAGHKVSHGPHNNQPYNELGENGFTRDCILCDPNGADGVHTDTDIQYDCRYCCFGKCVVIDEGFTTQTSDINVCNIDYMYNTEGGMTRYPNHIGRCVAPRRITCEEAVQDYCNCQEVIDIYLAEDTDDALCDTYCDKVVGWSDYFCRNCSEGFQAMDRSSFGSGGPGDGCTCEEAFWHIAHPGLASEEGVHHEGEEGEEYGEEHHEGEEESHEEEEESHEEEEEEESFEEEEEEEESHEESESGEASATYHW